MVQSPQGEKRKKTFSLLFFCSNDIVKTQFIITFFFFPFRNAISARNLIRLSTLLEKKSSEYTKIAQDTIESFYTELSKFSFAMPAFVSSFLLVAKGVKEVNDNNNNNNSSFCINDIDILIFLLLLVKCI